MTTHDPTATLPAACLRVLVEVLRMTNEGSRISVRKLCKRLGWRSANAVHYRLLRLRDAGLITYADGAYGTLRPRCRVEVWEGVQ